MARPPQALTIHLICADLPEIGSAADPVEVGLQDKEQNIRVGSRRQDGCMEYQCAVEVRADPATGLPGFYGPLVQGPPSARFL